MPRTPKAKAAKADTQPPASEPELQTDHDTAETHAADRAAAVEPPTSGLFSIADFSTLRRSDRLALIALGEENGIAEASGLPREELLRKLLRTRSHSNIPLTSSGVLAATKEGYGFLRGSEVGFRSEQDDIYVSPSQIRRFFLRTGDKLSGIVRAPRHAERFYSFSRITSINNLDPDLARDRILFDNLTPLYPQHRLKLETTPTDMTGRILDMMTPLGKGQRGLIVASPRTGKTVILQNLANSIATNHPEVTLLVVLIDERPEEVTDMQRKVKGEVIASTFDLEPSRHIETAEMVIEHARRLVEHGQDVVILLDSITRLARAYNNAAGSSSRTLSGGLDQSALLLPKKFFGAARAMEEGGSLTIIATALVDTGSRMDDIIFEEFKGTGNSEIVLDRRMMEKRILPAVDINRSGTRREELLLDRDELMRV
ncbi:MAG: transcription termination factor Rho [Vicinamibacteria bacterium]